METLRLAQGLGYRTRRAEATAPAAVVSGAGSLTGKCSSNGPSARTLPRPSTKRCWYAMLNSPAIDKDFE
jgi:hypothetical protein